jgi:hypothetical protein
MKTLLKKWCLILTFTALFSSALFSEKKKIELTGFGAFNLNCAFPGRITRESLIESLISSFPSEWKAFFYEPVLEQKNGIAGGVRVALGITSHLSLEGTVEYDLTELRFVPEAIEALKAQLDSSGYAPYMTYQDSAGSITRFYGNVNYRFRQGHLVPYLTAGIGLTRFTTGPSIREERVDVFDERTVIYYYSKSEFTINCGFGLSTYFHEKIGLRVDVRTFHSFPLFKQSFGYKWLGWEIVPEFVYVVQRGYHLDSSLNVGIVFRL